MGTAGAGAKTETGQSSCKGTNQRGNMRLDIGMTDIYLKEMESPGGIDPATALRMDQRA